MQSRILQAVGGYALHIMQDCNKIYNIGLLWFIRYPHVISCLTCFLLQIFMIMGVNYNNITLIKVQCWIDPIMLFSPPWLRPCSDEGCSLSLLLLLLPPPAPAPAAASVLRNEAHGQLAFSSLPLTNLKRALHKATRKVDLFETDDLQSKTWQANVTSGCFSRTVLFPTVLRSAVSLQCIVLHCAGNLHTMLCSVHTAQCTLNTLWFTLNIVHYSHTL